MKIGPTDPLPHLSQLATPAASPSLPSASPATITSAPRAVVPTLAAQLSAARVGTEQNRLARVQELANQISRGQYQPIPAQIARAILDEAAVDARLEQAGLREYP